MAVTYLAAYDISEDQRRARLAALLQAYGDRIQKSVFLLNVDANELSTVTTKAGGIMNVNTDSLWVLRQCAGCWEVSIQLGQASRPDKRLLFVVM